MFSDIQRKSFLMKTLSRLRVETNHNFWTILSPGNIIFRNSDFRRIPPKSLYDIDFCVWIFVSSKADPLLQFHDTRWNILGALSLLLRPFLGRNAFKRLVAESLFRDNSSLSFCPLHYWKFSIKCNYPNRLVISYSFISPFRILFRNHLTPKCTFIAIMYNFNK